MKAVFETSFKARKYVSDDRPRARAGGLSRIGTGAEPALSARRGRSRVQPRVAETDAHRFDVELLLEPVQDLVADGTLISQRDQRSALG